MLGFRFRVRVVRSFIPFVVVVAAVLRFAILSSRPNARLISIEYVISARLFVSLPLEEKKLWHRYE